jgi:hypothetical protein
MPVEETRTELYPEGLVEFRNTWKLVKPGEVELLESYEGRTPYRTVFKVDSAGRILTEEKYFEGTVAQGTREFRYSGGLPDRIVHKAYGKPYQEEWLTWSEGKLTRYAFVDLEVQDTLFRRISWKGDRIDSIRDSSYYVSHSRTYEYPTPDSVHMTLIGSGRARTIAYRLRDGRLDRMDGLDESHFKWGPQTGNRARARMPALRTGSPKAFRDWLGRSRGHVSGN